MNHLVHSSVPRRPEGTEGGRPADICWVMRTMGGKVGEGRKGRKGASLYDVHTDGRETSENAQNWHKNLIYLVHRRDKQYNFCVLREGQEKQSCGRHLWENQLRKAEAKGRYQRQIKSKRKEEREQLFTFGGFAHLIYLSSHPKWIRWVLLCPSSRSALCVLLRATFLEMEMRFTVLLRLLGNPEFPICTNLWTQI